MVEEVINLIRNSIGVCVTFNGITSYDKHRDSDIRKGLVMRILWSYFIDEKKLGWYRFYEKFSECFDSLDTFKAIDSIILHSRKSVLLCVDETMKVMPKDSTSDPLENIEAILNALYLPYQEFSDKAKKFHFVISTLDSFNVYDVQTKSHRPINWIPIRRLVLSESANLFRKLLENLERERVCTMRIIISDCNGHPRTLENFREILDDDTALKTDYYASLTERLARSLKPSLGRISLPIVRLALLGEEIPLTCEIETFIGRCTLKDLISTGMYINSLTNIDETLSVVPTLSPIALQFFCLPSKTKRNEDANAIANILKRLLVNEFFFEKGVLDGKPFERFHGNWELLYRELRKNTIVDLNSIYSFPEDSEIKIKLQRKKIAYCHSEIEFPPGKGIYDQDKKPFENLVDYLFVPEKTNNSGFDMVTFEKKADESGYIAINIECRFSYPDKTTKFSSRDITDKYDLMIKKYQNHVRYSRNQTRSETDSYEEGLFYDKSAVGKLKMNEDDIYLVFVIWRDVGKINYSEFEDKNIIIVERENLERIYTPTLTSRPYFYSEIFKEIKG